MAKKMERDEYNRYLEESGGYERDLWSELRKSRRTAWIIAGISAFMGVAGIGAGIAGLSQDAPAPTVLRVDQATGAVDVISTISNAETSYGDVVETYWINNYVLTREGYDWNTIQATYDAVGLLTAPAAQADFYSLYDTSTGRQTVLGNRARITPQISSITLGGDTQTATVRFTTQTVRDNGITEPPQYFIATIAYRFLNAQMTEAQRRINPLGFQVTSYRVDAEVMARGAQ